MFHKNRGNRRKVSFGKAVRKKKLCLTIYHCEWYDNLHEYSKNKIHCSCPMCGAKTRGYYYMGGRYHPPISDLRKIEGMKAEEENYDSHGREIDEEEMCGRHLEP